MGASRHEWDCSDSVEAIGADGVKFPFATVAAGIAAAALGFFLEFFYKKIILGD